MQRIGNVRYQPSRESAPPMPDLSELWIRMTELYGHRWLSQYGETPADTWIRGLADMSTADLGTGIIACVKSGESWPPSLPEFRAYCRPPKRENAAAYVYSGPMLPHKLSDEDRAKGRAAIAAAMRVALEAR